MWEKGVLTGPGEIVHSDHKITGKFLDNENMEMPVQVTFKATPGPYRKILNDPVLLGQEEEVAAAT